MGDHMHNFGLHSSPFLPVLISLLDHWIVSVFMGRTYIKYTFKKFQFSPDTFRGLSKHDFGVTMKYLEEGVLHGCFRKSVKFLVISSYFTRLGVIDCFVN